MEMRLPQTQQFTQIDADEMRDNCSQMRFFELPFGSSSRSKTPRATTLLAQQKGRAPRVAGIDSTGDWLSEAPEEIYVLSVTKRRRHLSKLASLAALKPESNRRA